ncbi:MAG TPA: 2-oxo-4-hydroxy-4-carboxy-5-ureidoimidazoline decarboxylase [Gemmatimonadota bacterium]|nr:2-oxo-4-hydroxy-4-carboxy-5-ureidoimidazoline decarboxylase [Gemmatimonadota bacterium]
MSPLRPVAKLNALTAEDARMALREVCGSSRWARTVESARPFHDAEALHHAAEEAWDALVRTDWLEAFAAHPRIGEDRRVSGGEASDWSRAEQAAVAAAGQERDELEKVQHAYERLFGWPYIVCATGRTAAELLADCRDRMANEPEDEIGAAAGEERRIGRLRLVKLLADLEFSDDDAFTPAEGTE